VSYCLTFEFSSKWYLFSTFIFRHWKLRLRYHDEVAFDLCSINTSSLITQVFQRRVNGSVDFYRNWTEYSKGFGELTGEFWLGMQVQLNYAKLKEFTFQPILASTRTILVTPLGVTQESVINLEVTAHFKSKEGGGNRRRYSCGIVSGVETWRRPPSCIVLQLHFWCRTWVLRWVLTILLSAIKNGELVLKWHRFFQNAIHNGSITLYTIPSRKFAKWLIAATRHNHNVYTTTIEYLNNF